MNEKRNAWVAKVSAEMRNAEKNNAGSIGAVIVNNTKVIVTITKNIDHPSIGVAVCKPDDTFDLDTGLAIAYTKAKGKSLPCFITCDGCDTDKDYEDDYYEDEDYEDEDEDYEDEDEDELYPLNEVEIGGKFLDEDGELCIKIDTCSYYCYSIGEIVNAYAPDDEVVQTVL